MKILFLCPKNYFFLDCYLLAETENCNRDANVTAVFRLWKCIDLVQKNRWFKIYAAIVILDSISISMTRGAGFYWSKKHLSHWLAQKKAVNSKSFLESVGDRWQASVFSYGLLWPSHGFLLFFIVFYGRILSFLEVIDPNSFGLV